MRFGYLSVRCVINSTQRSIFNFQVLYIQSYDVIMYCNVLYCKQMLLFWQSQGPLEVVHIEYKVVGSQT